VCLAAGARRRILIVDDEPLLGRALGKELGGRHEVVVVGSGADAIELLLADDRFDLVLCDVNMPSMSGVEVYEEIRQLRPGVHERFVFMTGGTFGDRATKQLEKLPNLRLEKPFRAADVEALFRRRARKA
jgi:CheY-like chemotaxis protein